MAADDTTSLGIFDKITAGIRSVFAKDKQLPDGIYVPPMEEEQLLEKLNMIMDACRTARKKKEAIWDKAHEFVHENIQWEQPKPEGMADYTGNMLFANVRHKAALVTDSRPMYNIAPMRELPMTVVDPQTGEQIVVDETVLDKMKSLIEDYGWYHWNLEQVVEAACIDAFTYGIGIVKVQWDKQKEYPFGDVAPYRVSPFCFYVFPRSGEYLQDAEGCVEARVMRVDELSGMFPGKGKYICAEDDFSEIRYDKEIESSDAEGHGARSMYGTPDSSLTFNRAREKGAGGKYGIPRAMVYEMYIKDNETEEVEQPITGEDGQIVMDPLTGEIETETVIKKKYPRGRLIIWTNNIILFDGDNPNKDGKFPYAAFTSYSIPGQFWGCGEYEAHHKSQKAWNRLMCQMIDHYNGANSKWLVEEGALQKNKKLTKRPWEVVQIRRGYKAEMKTPPPLPQDYFAMLTTFRAMIDLESGIHDISRGEKTPGLDKVGIALSLKESDFTRLRPVIRNFERFISEIGEMCISRIIQYNKANRKYTFINQQTGQPEVLEIAGLPDDVDLSFKVTVKSNSTLPSDKPSRAATAMQLFNMGVIGPMAMLKAIDWPNIQETIQESQMLQQLQAQLQQSEQMHQEHQKQIKSLTTENNELQNRARISDEEAAGEKLRGVITKMKAENSVAQAQERAANRS
jgi:hypothetical protein